MERENKSNIISSHRALLFSKRMSINHLPVLFPGFSSEFLLPGSEHPLDPQFCAAGHVIWDWDGSPGKGNKTNFSQGKRGKGPASCLAGGLD